MRPQTRPFTVESKSRRRALDSSHPNRSTGPSSDDLPSRDVREDLSTTESYATPLAAANRVFSAFARNAISTAASLGELTASVFTPTLPQDPFAEAAPAAAPAIQEGPARRVLPSLLPVNRFEDAQDRVPASVKVKAAVRKLRKLSSKVAKAGRSSEAVSSLSGNSGSDLIPQQSIAPASKPEPPTVSARTKPKRGRAEARVRPGERWKRRLPKACR
jgi:hypothetical protein